MHTCACAVGNALDELAESENPEHVSQFSSNINKYLCESLFFLHSDVDASEEMGQMVRELLIAYRSTFGLSVVDFMELPPPYDDDDCPPFSCDCAETANYILENTTVGSDYYLIDIEEAVLPIARSKKIYTKAIRELMEMKYLLPSKEEGVVKRVL